MMKRLFKQAFLAVLFGSVIFLLACEEDETPPPAVVAAFTHTVDQTTGAVTFTNNSQNATDFAWDFDDGTTSSIETPPKTYSEDGTYTVTLTASGAGGSDTFSDDVVIALEGGGPVDDTTAPVIELTGDNPLTINEGEAYTDPGYAASDDIDGDITDDVVVGGDEVNTDDPGTYNVTYDVSDEAGNDATTVTREVIVADVHSNDGGLIANGDFESGDAGWSGNALQVQTESGNSFNFASVDMAGAASDVNISYGLEITQGEFYTLTFEASSDRERSLVAGIGLYEDPWTAATATVDLTTETQSYELDLSAADFGGTNSRVIFDMGAAEGVVVIDNVNLVVDPDGGSGGGDPAPTDAPAAPTQDAANVLALFSDSYPNNSINVETWSASWDNADEEDLDLNGNAVKKVTFTGDGKFLGVEFINNSVDASAYTHFHMDFWIADDWEAGQVLLPKWSNWSGGMEVNAIEYTRAIGDLETGTWVSVDVSLDDFAAINGSARDNLSQFVIGTGATLDVVYFDNIYFYTDDGGGGGGSDPAPTEAPDAPTRAEANVLSLFSDSYSTNVINVETWSASWDEADQEDVDLNGNTVKKVSFFGDGKFLGVEFINNAVDASAYTHFHMDFWIADDWVAGQVLLPKWSNWSGGSEANALEYTKAIGDLETGTWISVDVPLTDFNGINGSAVDNLSQFVIGTGGTLNLVYFDNIYFYNE